MASEAQRDVPFIFIVDDDEAVRDSLKLLLETHGMEVAGYASTEGFAHSYQPHSRQCLILDQHLQGVKTGLDFLGTSNWAAMRFPVILITGRGDSDIKARALDAGVTVYLDKPIDARQLIGAIQRVIGPTV